jgi:DNA recombination protein RmuC
MPMELLLIFALILLVILNIYFFIKYQNTNKQLTNFKNLKEQLNLKELELVKYQTKLEASEKNSAEKISLLKDSESDLKKQFENLATKILEKNSESFSKISQEKINTIVSPMQTQLKDFKEKVESVYLNEAKERSALSNELKTLKELNQKISTEAHNLTTALKGNNKTQGSWGEMILEQVLNRSGLRAGEEYLREKTLKNSSGETYRPDVVVNLPQDRQVIIDAKTSLVDYEDYSNDNNDASLKAHINSINKHIDGLADKDYENLQGINTLDFVFMFIPIESALMLALENDKDLFDKAFKKKIVLVSPTTLLIALKAVENSWRYEKQAKNTEEVVRLATKLYDKVRGFTEDFEKVGKNLNSAQKTYDDAFGKLTSGKDNIIRQIEVFKDKSNIKPKKQIAESYNIE